MSKSDQSRCIRQPMHCFDNHVFWKKSMKQHGCCKGGSKVLCNFWLLRKICLRFPIFCLNPDQATLVDHTCRTNSNPTMDVMKRSQASNKPLCRFACRFIFANQEESHGKGRNCKQADFSLSSKMLCWQLGFLLFVSASLVVVVLVLDALVLDVEVVFQFPF